MKIAPFFRTSPAVVRLSQRIGFRFQTDSRVFAVDTRNLTPETLSRLYLHKKPYTGFESHFFCFYVVMQRGYLFKGRINQSVSFSGVNGLEVFFADLTKINPEFLFFLIIKILLGFVVQVIAKGTKTPFNRPLVPAETAG